MKIKVIITVLFFCYVNFLSQWEKQINFSGAGYAIDAKDGNFAVFASGTNVYYTNNGGTSWIQKSFTHAIDLSVIDENNIWIVTGLGKIYKSDTSFTSPTEQLNDPTKVNFINYIEMFDSNNGIAMGDAYSPFKEVVFKTTDGGTNWNVVSGADLDSMVSGDFWRRIDFVDMNVGYFFESGVNPQKLLKTTDGGASWSETSFNKNAHIIKFYNEDIGLAYETGKIYRTTNGGTSWDEFGISSTCWGNDIEFLPGDSMKVWLVTSEQVFYSSNLGSAWMNVSINREGKDLRDIIFVDENNGWILGDGIILHTNTGGLSNIQGQPNQIPDNYSLEQNYPNPFNPSTNIKFSLPEASIVKLSIYNILGEQVSLLKNEQMNAGVHTVDFNAGNLTSGVYFYRIEAEDFTEVKKMILLK
ncbi:MAG: T9SS type A sorting domain-containing protein [Ignavibacteriales bacterium]|nr:T9SS type A sorting domain-containing protein [Ignavibacteriales bacterium]